MPSQHKHPPIPFRPSEAQRDRLLSYAETTGLPVNRVLRDALDVFFADLAIHVSEHRTEPPSHSGHHLRKPGQ